MARSVVSAKLCARKDAETDCILSCKQGESVIEVSNLEQVLKAFWGPSTASHWPSNAAEIYAMVKKASGAACFQMNPASARARRPDRLLKRASIQLDALRSAKGVM
jgi:hypothetical protein